MLEDMIVGVLKLLSEAETLVSWQPPGKPRHEKLGRNDTTKGNGVTKVQKIKVKCDQEP
jgi:hypothetical protein